MNISNKITKRILVILIALIFNINTWCQSGYQLRSVSHNAITTYLAFGNMNCPLNFARLLGADITVIHSWYETTTSFGIKAKASEIPCHTEECVYENGLLKYLKVDDNSDFFEFKWLDNNGIDYNDKLECIIYYSSDGREKWKISCPLNFDYGPELNGVSRSDVRNFPKNMRCFSTFVYRVDEDYYSVYSCGGTYINPTYSESDYIYDGFEKIRIFSHTYSVKKQAIGYKYKYSEEGSKELLTCWLDGREKGYYCDKWSDWKRREHVGSAPRGFFIGWYNDNEQYIEEVTYE